MKSSKSFSALPLIPLLWLLGGCEIGAQKPVTEETSSPLVAYFFADASGMDERYQFQTDVPLRNVFSTFQGRMLAIDPSSSLAAMAAPAPGCRFASEEKFSLKILSPIDPGSMSVRPPAPGIPIPLTKESDYLIFNNLFLAPGEFSIFGSGRSNRLALNRPFTMPAHGANLSLISGVGAPQSIPSPLIDSTLTLEIQRSQALELRYTEPADFTFARLTLADYENAAASKIVCYANPGAGKLQVDIGHLGHFPDTENGTLELQFVKIDYQKSVGDFSEYFLSSSVRHLHGPHVGCNPANPQDCYVFSLGKVKFEP